MEFLTSARGKLYA